MQIFRENKKKERREKFQEERSSLGKRKKYKYKSQVHKIN